MENLTATQQEILNLQVNDWGVINRIKLSQIDCSEYDLIAILKHINNSIKDKNPKYVQLHADGKTCTIYNSIGMMLRTNVNLSEYKHLEIKNWKNKDCVSTDYFKAKKALSEKLARLKKLPVFQNGNLYAKTKAEINKLINN